MQRTLTYTFALLYLTALVWILFFIHIPTFDRSLLQVEDVPPQFVPFKSITHYLKAGWSGHHKYSLFSNVIGNVLLFVPWGILSAWLVPLLNSGMKVAAVALIASTGAELLQYIFHLGVFDVDDILLNMAGGFAGYWLLTRWQKLPSTS